MRAGLWGRMEAWAGPVLAACAACAAFIPALDNGFVWDDRAMVLGRPEIRALAWENLRWMFTTFHVGHYQPLSWLSLAVDFRLWGLNPSGYHLTNLLLHGANAAVFCLLAERLLSLARGQPGREARFGAALAALAFAVHPLRVESVAWVTERRDLLCAFFYLLAALFYVRGHAEPSTEGLKSARLRLALACCFLALLSKAMAVSLPAVLLILDYYPLGRLGRRADPGKVGLLFREKAPHFALALGFGLAAIAAQLSIDDLVGLNKHGLAQRMAQAAYGLAFYFWKTLIPTGLSPLYALPREMSLLDSRMFLGLAGLAALWLGLRACGVTPRAGKALALYYAVVLLPVLGLLQNGPQLVAVRYSYLSCLGWALLAGAAAEELRRRRLSSPSRAAGWAAIAAVLLGWGRLARSETLVWRDEISLWSRAVRVEPQSLAARRYLGEALTRGGRFGEAAAQFQEVLRIAGPSPTAWRGLGYALVRQGRFEEAISALGEAVRLDPDRAYAHTVLGMAHAERGRWEEAEMHLRRAASLEPGSAQAQNNLGAVLIGRGRLREAIERFEQARRIDPQDPSARKYLERAKKEAKRSISTRLE